VFAGVTGGGEGGTATVFFRVGCGLSADTSPTVSVGPAFTLAGAADGVDVCEFGAGAIFNPLVGGGGAFGLLSAG
jgi:hypothetical protein